MLHKNLVLETKNVGLYTLEGGGRGSEKVYCLYTHENVDILDGPLALKITEMMNDLFK